MYLLIGADLVPTRSNVALFRGGKIEELIGEKLKSILYQSSYRVFNLETPLADTECPIIKEGPNLAATTSCVLGYKDLRVDLVTLANNHIMDQGILGLESTIDTLDKNGISHLGTGANLQEASKPYVFEFNKKRIGVYACVEHEFSIAGDNTPGANPFDPLWSFDCVAELKECVDYVIVLYHGGKEHYRYPSPNLQKICKRLVDKGADLVICQHSHCIGCEEKYQAGTIVYGQGNFIFDDSDEECWQTSLLVKLDKDFSISYLPLTKNGNGVRLAEGKKAEEILNGFKARSEEIKKPGFIETKYAQFADTFVEFYLGALSGNRSLLFRILNKLTKGIYMKQYLQDTYGTKSKVRIANYIDCEAHRELLSQALSNGYKRKRQ